MPRATIQSGSHEMSRVNQLIRRGKAIDFFPFANGPQNMLRGAFRRHEKGHGRFDHLGHGRLHEAGTNHRNPNAMLARLNAQAFEISIHGGLAGAIGGLAGQSLKSRQAGDRREMTRFAPQHLRENRFDRIK